MERRPELTWKCEFEVTFFLKNPVYTLWRSCHAVCWGYWVTGLPVPLADPCVLQHLLLTTRGVGTWWKEGMFHFKISEVHHIPLKFLNSPGDSGCAGLQQHRGPACLSCCGEVLLVSPVCQGHLGVWKTTQSHHRSLWQGVWMLPPHRKVAQGSQPGNPSWRPAPFTCPSWSSWKETFSASLVKDILSL